MRVALASFSVRVVLVDKHPLARFAELAARAERRAARARGLAGSARGQAEREAAYGNRDGERFFMREAVAHTTAARANELTAAMYRRKVRRLVRW